MTTAWVSEQVDCGYGHTVARGALLDKSHRCVGMVAAAERGARLMDALLTVAAEDDETEEHFPWHYTGYGVVCACGEPMDSSENCLRNRSVSA